VSIVRHDWWVMEPSTDYECQYPPGGDGYWSRGENCDCRGCGAIVPSGVMHMAEISSGEGQAKLDKLWHEKYRPMAALLCLIEDADDCSA